MASTISNARPRLRQDHGDLAAFRRSEEPPIGNRSALPAPVADWSTIHAPKPRESLAILALTSIRRALDRVIAASSLVPNAPVLDVRAFPWTQALRDNWRTIRDEAVAVALLAQAKPGLAAIPPDHARAVRPGIWQSFRLWRDGDGMHENAIHCPVTSALIGAIPGLHSAFFSILAPGARISAPRGFTKGLITCHLALVVPRDGDARMRIADRVVRWAEGETLVFDDTYPHAVWNDTAGTRMILLLQVARPLRNPGRWIADRIVAAMRGPASVRHMRGGIAAHNGVAQPL
ncbi:aspartyl/asparaginyl beta-hydroxylase domain-containing protein [Sphingomonas sp. NBWT7]|uniref:aspartyl/asparaginyl beta-hydroxylase domain-containing protein n=1 Tax=Sphingomonas sp. NBWT7 TaxID=2596913 RepID=UPI001628AD65|nr:aspartyl/asparaginyl beta-hydroxylase domain-containing protein [Sphingomonas sp. NBWT7]QNE31689.1 aspartyl/asparaginyl beta-hydroxylase domain-containing protein [Sphingomonas sp. NBWT7]